MGVLRSCPFCGGSDIKETSQTLDERSGYNIVHTIQCAKCGCAMGTASHHDNNGWCIEGRENVAERAMAKWELRHEPDAERYRWLRDKSAAGNQFYLSTPLWFTGVRFRPWDVDNAIDAMAKGEQ